MLKNLKIQNSNVLTELNHNVGNPHKQYVGNNKDTMLKPTLNDIEIQKGNFRFWKFAKIVVPNDLNRKFSISFDLIEDYLNNTLNRSTYDIIIHKMNESTSSTTYYKNNVFVKAYGDEMGKIFITEDIKGDNIEVGLYVKLDTFTTYNTCYISIRFLNTNILDYELFNNTPPIANIPNNVVKWNTLKDNSISYKKCNVDNGYQKLIEIDSSYNESCSTYVFTVFKGLYSSANDFGYVKCLLKIYGTTSYASTRLFVLDKNNFPLDKIRLYVNDRKLYVYCVLTRNEVCSITLDNILDYSNKNRELTVRHFEIETNEPSFSKGSIRTIDEILLLNSADNTNYSLKINNYNLELFDSTNNFVGRMVKPRDLYIGGGSTNDNLRTDLDALIQTLKDMKILNS